MLAFMSGAQVAVARKVIQSSYSESVMYCESRGGADLRGTAVLVDAYLVR